MKLPDETQTMRRPFRLAAVALCLLFMLWLTVGFATMQSKRPISKDGLVKSLRIGGVSSNEYVRQIRERGVDFELTPAIEKELRAAGATSAMIEAIRANYRPPVPRPTPTPAAPPARSTVIQTAPQIEMVLIPAGTFTMGSPDSETGRSGDEGPQHRVSVRQFYMGKYEVTQAQWRAVMGTNPSFFKGNDRPVEMISWDDAVEFCRKLTQLTGRKYRLPTEAEWEYACRAGTTTMFSSGMSLMTGQANFYNDSFKGDRGHQTMSVRSFRPNKFGLYNMQGNVWEWCLDWYHLNYDGAPTDGSAWLSGGTIDRIVRGGAWDLDAVDLRSANRGWYPHDTRANDIGFRVVQELPYLANVKVNFERQSIEAILKARTRRPHDG